jgi:predicted dehydrogenase
MCSIRAAGVFKKVVDELNVALVGGGAIARGHAAAMHLVPFYFPDVARWRPRLVCEATEDLARAASARLGFEAGAVGWENAVHRPDIDAVIIATPPDLHHDIAIAAVHAGKHVLCEKPLARTASEAAEMVQAADAAGGVALVGFNYRCAPALRQAKRMLREHACGEVFQVSGRYFQEFARDATRPLNWRYQAARGGSGALGDIGTHLLDCARWLAGEMTEVVGVKRTVIAERPTVDTGATAAIDVDDQAALLARFDSGALGAFELSRVAAGHGNQLRLEIYGRDGSLSFDWERNNELQFYSALDAPDRQGFRRIVAGPTFPVYPAPLPVRGLGVGFLETMVVQAAEFARAISGAPVGELATFHDGLRACSLVDAVLQSSTDGRWADVPKLEG